MLSMESIVYEVHGMGEPPCVLAICQNPNGLPCSLQQDGTAGVNECTSTKHNTLLIAHLQDALGHGRQVVGRIKKSAQLYPQLDRM